MLLRNSIRNAVPVRNFFTKFIKQLIGAQESPDRKEKRNFGDYEVVVPWDFSSEKLPVPSCIPKPSYSESGLPEEPPESILIKNPYEIECMRGSCSLAKSVLRKIRPMIKPDVTTEWLDQQIHEIIINNGAYPSPLNYKGFPKSICTSVNNVICHGIPDERPLLDGDIINVDVTVYYNGYHGDCSEMYKVGKVDEEASRLVDVTEMCLNKAISICRPGERFCNIGITTQEIAIKNGFNIIPHFTGHGIGKHFHEAPNIFHYANDYPGTMLPGMIFTIEPALTQGAMEIKLYDDGWTAVTADDARAAQMEHTILITENGCEILTC